MNRLFFYFILLQPLFLLFLLQSKRTAASMHPCRDSSLVVLKAERYLYPGVVKATTVGALAFKRAGQIISMPVQSGQYVRQGEVIAKIQATEEELHYQATKKEYQTAETIYLRNKRLLEEGAVSLQDFEIAKTNYQQASAALGIAQRALADTWLRAPFSGFIEKKMVKNFDVVKAGQPIVQLVEPERLEIHLMLPITDFSFLQLPKQLYVEFDAQKGIYFQAAVKEYLPVYSNLGLPIILNITDKQFKLYQDKIMPGFSCQIIWLVSDP